VDEAPGLQLDELEAEVVAAYDARYGLEPAALPEDVLTRARDLVADHRVDVGR
jgi:hypothetical protein